MDYSNWPGVVMAGWQQFVSHASEYIRSGGAFAYRGQADAAWELQPTLLRHSLAGATPEEILELERQLFDEFRAQAHLHLGPEHLPARTESPISWWALMQHYGAPTRLLDWTQSPYVAAYFAVEKLPAADGVVFVIDVGAIQAGLNATYQKDNADFSTWAADLLRPEAPQSLAFWAPPIRRSARLVAQQGLFSTSTNVAGRHQTLREICTRHGGRSGLEPARYWTFPAGIKDEILKNLRATNIAAHSLFPGLDGLGRSVGEIARIGRSGVTQTISLPTIPLGSRAFPPSVAEVAADADNRAGRGMFGNPTFVPPDTTK